MAAIANRVYYISCTYDKEELLGGHSVGGDGKQSSRICVLLITF